VQYQPLFRTLPAELQSDRYLLSRYRKPANFSSKLASFHSYSTNIGCIAYLNARGERAANTAQLMYWSCHNMIRTQKLHCSQSAAKFVGTVKWNHGLVPTRPMTHRFMSIPGNKPALVTRFGFLRGSWPGPGPPGRFQLGPQPGNVVSLLTQLQTLVNPQHQHTWSTSPAIQDAHLRCTRVLMELSWRVAIAIWTHIQ